MEILVEADELHLVPAHPDAEPEAAAAEHVETGSLLGNQNRLTLRENQHLGGEFDLFRAGSDETERHEGVVEQTQPTRTATGGVGRVATEHVVRQRQTLVALGLRELCEFAHNRAVAADVAERQVNSEMHGRLLVRLVAGRRLIYRFRQPVPRHWHGPGPARRRTVIKLGYKASAEQFAPADLLGFSCLAEQVGFDSVFISDHFQPWKHVDGHAPFSLTWLGALGARTSRVVIGTSVLTPTFRYHPSIVAQAFGTMGAMFPGRVVLGIGTGEGLNEVPSTGQPWPEFKERFARLRESVSLIRALWTQERVSFEGQYYKTEKATIYDRPEAPVPIYVAAAGALVARYAGRSAEGFICTSGKKPELYTETLLPKVAEGIAASEDPSRAYDRMIEVKVSFDTDKARALEDTRYWAALALTPEEKMTVEDPVEMQRLADALPLERAASRWIVSSDADEHVERIGYYVGLGFRHLVFHAPGPADATQQRYRTPCRPRHSADSQGRRSRRLDR